MGKQVRIQEVLKPVVRLLKEAYNDHMFTADEAYAMAHYMAYEMPEELRQNVKRRVSQRMALMAEKEENEGVSESVSLEVTQGVTHKDERSDKEKRTKKEINKKEENDIDIIDIKKIQKKSFFSVPSFDEVKRFHKENGITEFPVERFYEYYENLGWRKKNAKRILDWQKEMLNWTKNGIKNNVNLNERDDEKRRQTKGAGAKGGATREELQQAIIDYLDTHYPVADSGAEDMVAKGMGRDATLGEMAARLGQAPVLRMVTKRLFMTGYEMDLKPSMLRPQTLEKVAGGLCHIGWQLTMKQVNQFLLRCEEGTYGDFRGGLKTTTVLPALKKFMQTPQPPKGGE